MVLFGTDVGYRPEYDTAMEYELMKRADVPVAVIVSEYVDIAKAFYEEDEPKLVNAVLDRVSRRVRGEGRGKDAR